MTEFVRLSQETQDLILKIRKKDPTSMEPLQNDDYALPDNLPIRDLERWFFYKPQENKRLAFSIETLNASLLQDLYDTIADKPIKKMARTKPGWSAKLTFGLLVLAGTVYFACEGFDGVSALMGVFAVPPLPVFLVGVAFSLLSILIFYALELFSISNSLGIQLKSAPKIIDLYLNELRLMKGIRKKLAESFFDHNQSMLERDLLIIRLMKYRHQQLETAKEELSKSSRHWGLRALKIFTATLPGLIFFSAGFFAGQTVAIAVASLFMATVAPTFWPIILASILVGMASLTIYWIIQRPGIANIVSSAAGLDQEKLDELSSDKRGVDEMRALDNLTQQINAYCQRVFPLTDDDLDDVEIPEPSQDLALDAPLFNLEGFSSEQDIRGLVPF